MSEKEGCTRTDCKKQARLERCRQLLFLRKYPPHAVYFIWFSDEKLFTVAAPSNLQNDRVYVRSSVKKKDVDAARLLRTRPTFCKSLLISVAVSSLGATQLHFLEPGVKVNGDYYRNTVLLNMLLQDIRSVFGDYYVFQQDGAPTHSARDTVTMLQRETAIPSRDVATQFARFESGGLRHLRYASREGLPLVDP